MVASYKSNLRRYRRGDEEQYHYYEATIEQGSPLNATVTSMDWVQGWWRREGEEDRYSAVGIVVLPQSRGTAAVDFVPMIGVHTLRLSCRDTNSDNLFPCALRPWIHWPFEQRWGMFWHRPHEKRNTPNGTACKCGLAQQIMSSDYCHYISYGPRGSMTSSMKRVLRIILTLGAKVITSIYP